MIILKVHLRITKTEKRRPRRDLFRATEVTAVLFIALVIKSSKTNIKSSGSVSYNCFHNKAIRFKIAPLRGRAIFGRLLFKELYDSPMRLSSRLHTVVSTKVVSQQRTRVCDNADWYCGLWLFGTTWLRFTTFSQKEREGVNTHIFFLLFYRWNTLNFYQATIKPPLPKLNFDIVAFAFTFLWDNLSRNSCKRVYFAVRTLAVFWTICVLPWLAQKQIDTFLRLSPENGFSSSRFRLCWVGNWIRQIFYAKISAKMVGFPLKKFPRGGCYHAKMTGLLVVLFRVLSSVSYVSKAGNKSRSKNKQNSTVSNC